MKIKPRGINVRRPKGLDGTILTPFTRGFTVDVKPSCFHVPFYLMFLRNLVRACQ